MLTNILFPPPPPEEEVTEEAPVAQEQAVPAEAVRIPTPVPVAATGPADTVRVIGDLYALDLSTRGASVVGARLLDFDSYTQPGPVQLVPDGPRPFLSSRLVVGTDTVDLAGLPFQPSRARGSGPGRGHAERHLHARRFRRLRRRDHLHLPPGQLPVRCPGARLRARRSSRIADHGDRPGAGSPRGARAPQRAAARRGHPRSGRCDPAPHEPAAGRAGPAGPLHLDRHQGQVLPRCHHRG